MRAREDVHQNLYCVISWQIHNVSNRRYRVAAATLSCDRVRSGGIYGRLFTAPLATSLTSTHSCHSISEEGEGDFYFDEEEVLGGLDEEARAALLARQAAGMDLEEAEGELGEVSIEWELVRGLNNEERCRLHHVFVIVWNITRMDGSNNGSVDAQLVGEDPDRFADEEEEDGEEENGVMQE